MSRTPPLLFFFFLANAALGCGDDGGVGVLDSSVVDTSMSMPDSMVMPDTGELSCPTGRHLCGAGCVDDLANDPGNGCRLGCGEACDTPALGVASCTTAGTCDFTCEPPSSRVGDTCACTAMTCEEQGLECGAQTDGCGMDLDCGACPGSSTCGSDGTCGCEADAGEPNENRFQAHALGSFDDSDGTTMVFDTYALSTSDDEDWFVIDIVDGTDFSNPDIDVTLSDIPAGANFDLAVWFVCDDSTEDVTCSPGGPDSMVGAGCISSDAGSSDERVRLAVNCTGITTIDESGTAYVRITSRTWDNSCAPYTLTVLVE